MIPTKKAVKITNVGNMNIHIFGPYIDRVLSYRFQPYFIVKGKFHIKILNEKFKTMRICVYLTHYETLGHTTRMFNLLSVLKKEMNPEILIFQAGKPQKMFPLENLGRVIHLPYPLGKKFNERDVFLMIKDFSKLKKRIKIIKDEVRKFRPDVLLTEFFPVGKEGWYLEVPVLLKESKRMGARIVGSAGYPTFDFSPITREMWKVYDSVFIHSREMDLKYCLRVRGKSYQKRFEIFWKKHKDKIHFTGYIIRKFRRTDVRKALKIGNKKLIVISRGGRVIGTEKIIEYALKVKKHFPDEYFLISLGPSVERREMKKYLKIGKKLRNVNIKPYFPDFINYIHAANLSINMGGYNTCVELMFLKKQNICIPKSNEQVYRALMMKDLGICEVIEYNKLNMKELAEKIKSRIESPLVPKKISRKWFMGDKTTVEIIKNLL